MGSCVSNGDELGGEVRTPPLKSFNNGERWTDCGFVSKMGKKEGLGKKDTRVLGI